MVIKTYLLKSNKEWPYTFAKIVSALLIMFGALNLVGWTFYYWLPPELLPYLYATKPNTAICFILSSIALWFYSDETRPYTKGLAQICSAAVFLIGAITLLEYFFKANFGIDQWVVSIPTGQGGQAEAGRMSPFAAINFILIGYTLFFFDNETISYRLHQFLISFVLFFTLFEFINFLYRINNTIGIGGFNVSTVNAFSIFPPLVSFFLLGLGMLFVRPNRGIVAILTSNDTGGVLARRLIPPTMILPVLIGYLGLTGEWGNLYETKTGISILVTATIVFFICLLIYNAYVMNKVDARRKQAEANLRIQTIQLLAILDHTSSYIYITDLRGRFLLVNKQFEKIFHKSAKEIIGKNIREVFPSNFSTKFFEENNKVMVSREPIAVEEQIVQEEQRQIFISNKFPLFDDEGELYAIGGIATDITNVKQIHEIMRENGERLKLALKSAQAGTWNWDLVNDVVVWDEYMHYLFGLKKGSFPNNHDSVLRLICVEDRQRVARDFDLAIKNGSDFETEFCVTHADNTTHFLDARGRVYFNEEGKAVRMAGVCIETTERKRAEEQLKKSKETAETLAEEAEQANKAKSAFLAAMSHEIRTPLNGVIGMTALLMDSRLSAEQRETVENIRISGEALLAVINDILDYSKIESERMELEMTDFSLNNLIQEIIDMISPQTHRKGIAIGAYIEPNVPEWVTGDPTRLKQVLTNLVSNAEKFTEKGEISIRVKVVNHEYDQFVILFEVIDTGIGIQPEIQERLFKPFSQGDISTSRKFGGTGLGLAISKRLVEMMGGRIDVESLPGRGSRFWFTAKLVECVSPAPKMDFKIIPELRGARVLCTDDNAINREIIKRLTESWELRCDIAVNGGEALSLLKKAQKEKDAYCLLLTDYLMPGMSGIELVQVIRQLKDIADTPIIVLSSLGSSEDDEVRSLNIAAILSKPLRPFKLYQEVMSTLLKKFGIKSPIEEVLSPLTSVEENQQYKILLAEDNAINQQVAIRMLNKKGYRVDTVTNGLEAIEAMKQGAYDLVLMDCQMPEMDGYTATREIRKFEDQAERNKIPIIAMTAHALKGDKEKCLEAGMSDYISKPFNIKALTEILIKWLDHPPLKDDNKNEIPAVETSSTTSIDMTRLYDIFDSDKPAILSFLESFIAMTKNLLSDIELNIQFQDASALKEAFHKLKGSSANSGIMVISELSRRAEEKIPEKDFAGIEELLKEIAQELIKVQAQVKEMRA